MQRSGCSPIPSSSSSAHTACVTASDVPKTKPATSKKRFSFNSSFFRATPGRLRRATRKLSPSSHREGGGI